MGDFNPVDSLLRVVGVDPNNNIFYKKPPESTVAPSLAPDEIAKISRNAKKVYEDTQNILTSTSYNLSDEDRNKMTLIRDTARKQLSTGYDEETQSSILGEYKNKIDTAPIDKVKKVYKEMYTAYNMQDPKSKEDMGDADKQKMRNALAAMQARFMRENVNPDEVLGEDEKPLPFKALDVIGNTLMLPVNTVVKGVSTLMGNDEKWGSGGMPLWGANGFENLINTQYMKDPYYKGLVQKAALKQPLSAKEQKDFNDYQNNRFLGGLGLNLASLPLGGFGGMVAKSGVSGVKYLGKGLQLAGKLADPIGFVPDIVNTAKAYRGLDLAKGLNLADKGRLTTKGESYLDNAKRIALQTKETLPEGHSLIAEVDALLNAPHNPQSIPILQEGFKSLAGKLTAEGIDATPLKMFLESTQPTKYLRLPQDRGLIEKIGEMKAPKERPNLEKFQNWANEIGKNHPGLKAATGVVVNAPKNIASGFKKAFVGDVTGKAGKVFKEATDYKNYLRNTGKDVAQTVFDEANKIAKIKGMPHRNQLYEVLAEMVERKDKSVAEVVQSLVALKRLDPIKANNLLAHSGTLEKARDLISARQRVEALTELKDTGKTAIYDLEAPQTAKLQELAQKYRETEAISPFHTDLPKIQAEMENIIKNGTRNAANPATLFEGEAPNNLGYLMHTYTDEAREFVKRMHPTESTPYMDLLRPLEEGHTSQIMRQYRGKSTAEINALSREGKVIPGFKGDIYKTVLPEVLTARSNKTAFAAGNARLSTMLQNLSKTNPELMMLNPKAGTKIPSNMYKVPLEGVDLYAAKDVADEVVQLSKFVNREGEGMFGKILFAYDRIIDMWKKITLSVVPSYHIRNGIGNIFQSWAGGLNPIKNFADYRDGLVALNRGGVSFIGKNGVRWDTQKLWNEANRYNLIKNGFYYEEAVGQKIGKQKNAVGRLLGGLEDHAKMSLFINGLKRGMSPQEAALNVKKYLFDYNDLTRFEQGVMRRIVPFWTFIRKNLVLQMQNLLNPNAIDMINLQERIRNSFENQDPANVVDPRAKLDYLKEPTLLLGKKNNKSSEIPLTGIVPYYDIQTAFKPIQDAFNIAQGRTGDATASEAISGLSPIPKTILETGMNVDLMTSRPLETVEGQKVAAPFFGFATDPRTAKAMGNIRVLGLAEKLLGTAGNQNQLGIGGMAPKTAAMTDEEKIALLGIGKAANYDPGLSKMFNNRDISNKIKTELANIKTVVNRINRLYAGKQRPDTDIKLLEQAYETVFNQARTAYQKGMFNPNNQWDKRLIGEIAKTKELIDNFKKGWDK